MKYFSMFSGVGAFDLALNRLGHTCIGYSEIDKYAIQVYRKQFGEGIKNYGDATNINTGELGDIDILVAGFPCQAFSFAGRRKGFEDARGTLFYEVARVARDKRPRYILLENVKGLLSHDNGRTFRVIVDTFRELGYRIDYGLLNSRYFGVPQKRERVFVVGSIRTESRPEVFPIRRATEESQETVARKDYIQIDSSGKGHCSQNDRIYTTDSIMGAIPSNNPASKMKIIMGTVTEAFGRGGSSSEHIRMVDNINRASGQVRRLTPRECERLQGFPDDWTRYGIDDNGDEVEISDTQRYKMMGNSITVPVVEEIFKRLLI